MLNTHHIKSFTTQTGYTTDLTVTYQLFGQDLGMAPVVLVNHALTGNSSVTGKNGWWKELIGKGKAIDTDCYTILAIDIPGNGFGSNNQELLEYTEFHNRDIAQIQMEIVHELEIQKLFAVVGGSLGGQIAWELAILEPEFIQHLIPVATDWKASDWVIAQCYIQNSILHNSNNPLKDARMHAMTFYRTAASFRHKFERSQNVALGVYNVESWLAYHGTALRKRFKLSTYKLMNHLLGSADISKNRDYVVDLFRNLKCQVHLVAIDSDGLFHASEIWETHKLLDEVGVLNTYQEIFSIHGHDAFLIEYEQLAAMLQPIFEKKLCDVS